MRYTPLESELTAIGGMSTDERFYYAITRMSESEEVWSVGDDNGWNIHNTDGKQAITIWPYRVFAEQHCSAGSDDLSPQSTSLEHFIYAVLDMCNDGDIWLEIFPGKDEQGVLLKSADLYEIMNGMLETSEYFIEG